MKPGDHPEFFRFPAPEGQSRESTIAIDREGHFWHDGARVDHDRLARAMHGWIDLHPDDGRYILTNGYDWTYFRVDDTAYVVTAAHPREDGSIALTLSNDDIVDLEPNSLCADDDAALYVSVPVKGNVHEARFTRFAQSQLAPVVEEREDGTVGLRIGGHVVIPSARKRSPSLRWRFAC